MCVSAEALTGSEQHAFRRFCQLLQSVFHFEYHASLEALKDNYAPLNPDRDTRKVGVFPSDTGEDFVTQLTRILDKANYERVTQEEIDAALEESSLFKLKIDINFDDFEEAVLFARGEAERNETVASWFGLRKRSVRFSNYDRVVLYIKYSETMVARRTLYKPGTTILKMFRNVPKSDIEMLFPNTLVSMRLIDKLLIGVPAVVGGGIVLTTKLGTSLLLLGATIGFWLGLVTEPAPIDEAALIALLLGTVALGSFLYRQFSNFRHRKLVFMQTLTENLYFKNLDNNAGVFHRLIDDAEEEECKEAMLAYLFLWQHPDQATDSDRLDTMIEQWFQQHWQCELDFEVDDALAKLRQLSLVEVDKDGLIKVCDIDKACGILDRRWDAYFQYEHPTH
ncbi:MAG: TMEM143 family protein [Pseudomonadota bacterium]